MAALLVPVAVLLCCNLLAQPATAPSGPAAANPGTKPSTPAPTPGAPAAKPAAPATGSPATPASPAATPATPAAGTPAKPAGPSDATQTIEQMEKKAPVGPGGAGGTSNGGAGGGGTAQPAQPAQPAGAAQPIASAASGKLLREGSFLASRRGRVIKATGGEWQFHFDAGTGAAADGKAEAPIVLMPCLNLQAMEKLAERGGEAMSFTVSGQIFVYKGRNFLLPSLYTVNRRAEVTPAQ